MAWITQTATQVGSTLSGIGSNQTYGQAVFSIGHKYVFAAMATDQLTGTLIQIDQGTGAPLSVIKLLSWSITNGLPNTNSWNSGTTMHVTTIDGTIYMYIRWDGWNSTYTYRGIWDEATLQFKNFATFATQSNASLAGNNYNAMARMNDTTMRLISDVMYIAEFNIRTGAEIRAPLAVGGTWSPTSYPFVNQFVSITDPTTIMGASGDGTNWYYQTGTSPPAIFNPTTANTYADSFNLVSSSAHQIFPSQHHPVSYYTPNDGTIRAYSITGVYIQTGAPTTSATTNIGIFSATLQAQMGRAGTDGKFYFEYGTTTSYGTILESDSVQGPNNTMIDDLPGLAAGTTYNFRAYIMANSTKVPGPNTVFTTKTGLATLSTQPISSITVSSAIGNATIVAFDE